MAARIGEAGGRVGALRDGQRAVRLSLGDLWRTIHPTTSVLPSLSASAPGMFGPIVWCLVAFLMLFLVLVTARVRLEEHRHQVEELHLAIDDLDPGTLYS